MSIKQVISISFLAAAVLFQGCDTREFTAADINNISEEEVYSSVTYTRRVLYDLYGSTRQESRTSNGSFSALKKTYASCVLLDTATDDGAADASSELQMLTNYLTGAISTTSGIIIGDHPWDWYYAAIRRANTFMELVGGSVLEKQEILTSKAEARFLRALYYHELYRWFGPFVILEQSGDGYDRSMVRSDEKTCVQWLVHEFDELIAGDSGLQDVPSGADWGIATRGAALAYKARTLLYAASPLHRDSGVSWQQAADAALDMIKYAEEGGYYSLFPSYNYLFNTRKNSEYIYWYNRANSLDLYVLMPPFSPWNTTTEAGTMASQEFIDCFDMADGSEPFTYDSLGFATGINPASEYDEQKMYEGRDPRLNWCIMHDGTTWPKVNGSPATIDISTSYNWVSGYFVVKFLDDRIDHRASSASTCMNFPMMRYAEVLLNYAEAVNEASDTPQARQKAVQRLNQIRRRAGITNDLDAADFDQASLRQRIRKERRVELCWEEHRFFDIRRWGIASDVMTRPVHGIRKSKDGRYSRYTCNPRFYNPRMDLSPLPSKEVNLCDGIWQNPGY